MRYIVPACVIAGLLLMWHTACARGLVNSYVLPSPGKVWKTAVNMAVSGELWRDACISMARVLKGFGMAFILALILATVKALVPSVTSLWDWLLHALKHVAPLSMIPLLILWLGIGEKTKIVIIMMASFFPMYLSMVKGLTGCDRKLIEVGEVFGYSRTKRFWAIVLPAAVPDILLGMRTGLGYSWRAIIGAEMVAASTGLGRLILFSQQMSRTDKVIVGIVVISVVGWLTDALMGCAVRSIVGGKAGNGWD